MQTLSYSLLYFSYIQNSIFHVFCFLRKPWVLSFLWKHLFPLLFSYLWFGISHAWLEILTLLLACGRYFWILDHDIKISSSPSSSLILIPLSCCSSRLLDFPETFFQKVIRQIYNAPSFSAYWKKYVLSCLEQDMIPTYINIFEIQVSPSDFPLKEARR